ncbi:MAG: hypothetical protein ACRDTX_13475 [Pseudonocardiaceae bacterium]
MSNDQRPSGKGDRHVLCGCQTPDPQMILALRREDCAKLVCSGEVHRIVQAGIRTHAALEAACSPTHLSQQLDLQPALSGLHDVGGRLCPGQVSDAQQTYLTYEVDQALW